MKTILSVKLPILAVGASLLLSGCLPDVPEYIDELDLVYTNYSPGFNFSAQQTYALPDSVVKVSGNLATGDPVEFVTAIYGDRILQDLRDNMNANGWTEVLPVEQPDVVLLPIVNTTTTVNYYYDWGYWGWYYPSYPGGGWYYPGYYPPVVTSYKTGTLLVQMTYPAGRGENDQVPVEWVMVVDGLMEGSADSQVQRIDKNITQGFVQSPYLKIK